MRNASFSALVTFRSRLWSGVPGYVNHRVLDVLDPTTGTIPFTNTACSVYKINRHDVKWNCNDTRWRRLDTSLFGTRRLQIRASLLLSASGLRLEHFIQHPFLWICRLVLPSRWPSYSGRKLNESGNTRCEYAFLHFR